MNRTNEIELLTNPAYHTMRNNGYLKDAVFIDGLYRNVIFISYNKEYFN